MPLSTKKQANTSFNWLRNCFCFRLYNSGFASICRLPQLGQGTNGRSLLMSLAFEPPLRIECVTSVWPFSPSLFPLSSLELPYVQCMCGLFPLGFLCQAFYPLLFLMPLNPWYPLIKGNGWHDDRNNISVWPKDHSFPICVTGLLICLWKIEEKVTVIFLACCLSIGFRKIVEMSSTGIVWLFHLIENVGCYGFKCIAVLPLVHCRINNSDVLSAEHQLQTF